jgi:hypothetical protein
VSEYQYYEFLAVDRPLDAGQLDRLCALSTRAELTPTSLVNTYHWGDFKGKPRALMEEYSTRSCTPRTGAAVAWQQVSALIDTRKTRE